MRTLSWSLWLAASLCTAQTLELGDLAFLGADAFPETASVQVGPEGQVLVAGSAARLGLPVVRGSGRAYSPDDCGDRGVFVPCRDGYAALLEPSGEIRFATYFGGSHEDRIVDARFDPTGDVWLLVTSTSFDYSFDIDLTADGPTGLNRLLTRLDGDSGLVLSTTRLPLGSETLSVGPNGELFVAGHARPGMAEIGGLGLDIGIGGTFRSDDGGATWTTANGGLESPLVNVTAWPDGQGGTLLVGTALQDVYLSQDRGATWRRFASPEGAAVVSAAAVGGVAPQILASTQTGFFARRVDAPDWRKVLNERVDWIAPAPSDPTQVYAWGESGVSRSSNSGDDFQPTGWTESASPLESGGIAVDPADPNTVYLTSFNRDSLEASLIRSGDGGQTWTRTTIVTSLDLYDPGPFIRPPLALAVGPGSTLYAALPGGLLRTLDGGATWQAVDQEIRDRLAQGPLLVRKVFASGAVLHALTNVGLFRSTNGGNSWESIGTQLPANETPLAAITADPSNPQTLYVLAPSEGLGNVFVLKITPDARAVDYLAIIGGSGSDVVHKVDVDRLGRAWITGLTSSIDFPVVAGAPMPTYRGGGYDGFVAAIGVTGDRLDFSTFAGSPGQDRISGAALDHEDRLWALRSSQITENGVFAATNVLHSYSLSADSTETPFNLDRGANFDLDLEVDGQGRIWTLAGTFCTSPFCRPEESFLQVTDATGQRLGAAVLNEGVALALDQQGAAWVAGQGRLGITPVDPKAPTRAVGYLAQFRLAEPASGPTLGAVVQAAGFLGRPLVPGSIVSLFGEGLGPEQGSSFEIVEGSVLGATGSRVFFGNDEATVLYAQSGQVNAIIPSAKSGKNSVDVRVETLEGPSNSFHVPVADACPAIFQLDAEGRAAAVNQDGSVNSVHAPAVAGSVLAFFVTGLGGYTPGVEPQRVAPLEEPFPVASRVIQASLDDVALNIEYAGVAPGLVAAVSQLNLRLPEDAEPGARVIRLEAAGCSGASGLIEVRAAAARQAP